ncbi:MAG: AmmeMemoRadiSam system protein B [Elusimicrobia bacterium RIFCSPHIGHO2_01_FULL_64_10]|nr:MAG: AmmeMemoRadiSam system protein B [Elusimicrobia bacterium RIFCSPHIGHO2_01_FULL_64_10]
MTDRERACRGWYPDAAGEVLWYLDMSDRVSLPGPFFFGVVPHAGWAYSGQVAGAVYGEIGQVDLAIILGTNHTGLGPPSSVFPGGTWNMPLGKVRADEKVAGSILKRSQFLAADAEAHAHEHAVEVQLPFLQILNPHVEIAAIEMRDYLPDTCSDIAGAVAGAAEEAVRSGRYSKVAVLASSDMTHCGAAYGQPPPPGKKPGDFARRQDRKAIAAMEALDARGLLRTVREDRITMCGSGPAAAVMEAAGILGAGKGRLLKYATSAESREGGPSALAVGYAGMIFD